MAKSTWLDQLQQLLGGKSSAATTQQLVQEPLQRSARFQQELRLYIQHQESTHRELLRQRYQGWMLQTASSSRFVVLDAEHAAGFMWYVEAGVPEQHYDFLQDRLAELVLAQGYVEQQNEHKIWPVGETWHELHRRYLKPRLGSAATEQGLVDQRFGNVLLEVLRKDGRLHHLKMQCNVYRDQNYSPAQSFEALMALVLAGDPI